MQTHTPTSLRPFLLLWAGQALSVLGGAISFAVGSMWLSTVQFPQPTDKAALAAALTKLSLSYALPGILATPLAGVIADRYPRGLVMRLADLCSGIFCTLIALLAFAGALSLPLLYLLIALTTISTSIHGAALWGSYVLLVPEKHLTRANAMMQARHSGTAPDWWHRGWPCCCWRSVAG